MWSKIATRFIRRDRAGIRRIWYHALNGDLVIECDSSTGEWLSFFLDWDSRPGQRTALRWNRSVGLRASRIDTGDCLGALHHKRSPVVTWEGAAAEPWLLEARALVQETGLHPHVRVELLSRLA